MKLLNDPLQNADFNISLQNADFNISLQLSMQSQVQRKALLEQQEKLEIAQGHSDTALVRANWLIQMQDYQYLHQAEGIIHHMKDQLTDREYSNIVYQDPITTGEIPVYIPPSFLDQIDQLGNVGGGGVPVRLHTSADCGLLLLEWEETDDSIKEYEICYEPIEEEEDKFAMLTKGIQLPKKTQKRQTFSPLCFFFFGLYYCCVSTFRESLNEVRTLFSLSL